MLMEKRPFLPLPGIPRHFVLVPDMAGGLRGLEVARAMGLLGGESATGLAPPGLLSAVGAGRFMGVPWWQALVRELEQAAGQPLVHVLDCGASAPHAAMALAQGQRMAVLAGAGRQHDAVRALYRQEGGLLLACRPPTIGL